MIRMQWLVIAVVLGFLGGCSSKGPKGQALQEYTVLQEVNDLIHASTVGNRPPGRLADLNRRKEMFAHGYEAVKSGEVVVVWGSHPKGEGEVGKGETVLAYEKKVPTDGGFVLLSAGTIKKMSAADFNSLAPKTMKK